MKTLAFALLPILTLAPTLAHAATVARVAVLEFGNLSDDQAWAPLGKGLQELFVVDLDKASALDVVSRRDALERAAALGMPTPPPADARRRLASDLGAAFVVSGTFLITGDRLDLDVEILDAEGGRVVLRDRRSGEAEAFFELQKQSLDASIRALELELTPRERAEARRLHTADFLAFQDFSRGLDLFDAERYDASLTALRAATDRDVSFSLARLTLEAYEQLIAETRQKAQAIHAVKVEERRLARLQAAGDEVEVIRRLLEIANRSGPEHQRLRLTALHTLAVAYGNVGTRQNKLATLRSVEDRFAIARAGDRMWAQYQAEALPLWPRLPVQPSEEFYREFPKLATFDADLEAAAKRLWEHGADYPENRKNYLLNNLRYPRYSGQAMHLSVAQELALHDRFVDLGRAHGAPDYWLKSEDELRIKSYRAGLRFDDSTRILERFARESDNEWALKGFASEMETNRDAVAFLQRAPDRQIAQEWLMHGWHLSESTDQRAFVGGRPTPELLARVTRERRIPNNGFVLLDEVPIWVGNVGAAPLLGPLSDPRRTTAIRVNRPEADRLATFVLAGAEPLGSVTVTTTLRYTAPADFWPGPKTASPGDRGVASGRPSVGLLFGLVDVDVPLQKNAAAEQSAGQRAAGAQPDARILTRPMMGYMLRITADEAAIVRVTEAERGGYDRKERLDEQVLARAPLKKGAETVAVELRVTGDRAEAKVGGVKVAARLPEPALGFQGLWVTGGGFVEIDGLKLSGRAD